MVKTEEIKEELDETFEDDDTEPRIYELGYHILPSVSEDDIPAEIAGIKSLIKKNDGVGISEENPKNISLAYTMYRTTEGKKEKFDTAYFGWIKFEMDPKNALKVKEELDLNRNILRYIIIKTVRENTRTEMRTITAQTPKVDQKTVSTFSKPTRKPEKNVPVSEEELDRTIEKLVVE